MDDASFLSIVEAISIIRRVGLKSNTVVDAEAAKRAIPTGTETGKTNEHAWLFRAR